MALRAPATNNKRRKVQSSSTRAEVLTKVNAAKDKDVGGREQRSRGIQAFTKVSKVHVERDAGGKKRKLLSRDDNDDVHDERGAAVGIAAVSVVVKRRRVDEIVPRLSADGDGDGDERARSTSTPQPDEAARGVSTTARSGVMETPTKGMRTRLENLAVSSNPSSSSSPPPPSSPSFLPPRSSTTTRKRGRESTPPSSPPQPSSPAEHEKGGREDTWTRAGSLLPRQRQINTPKRSLPKELDEFTTLHASFLTALSLHYAHNGSTNPVSVRELCVGVEKVWRKRKVGVDDLRRVAALTQQVGESAEKEGGKKGGLLEFVDYGRGKICIELVETRGQRQHAAGGGRVIDEDALRKAFTRNLSRSWTLYAKQRGLSATAQDFVSKLSLLPITPCASLAKLTPLLSKGQRRLEDLKAGAIKAQARGLAPTATPSSSSSSAPQNPQEQKDAPVVKSASSRAAALLDRLHAKALLQSTLPAAPSSEEIARRRSLQRLSEITPVLASLVVSTQKHNNDDTETGDGLQQQQRAVARHVSFTMTTLTQHLQMSLRNPVGAEEATRCVRCLAEVAPEWVTIQEIGRFSGVTFRGQGIGRVEVEARVKRLLGDKE